jgi:virginiamycin B lyase
MAGTTVFISYSRKQFYIAEQLARIIEQNGLAAWIDVQEIAPGSDWQASIDQGLAACHAFVVLASRSAQRSAAVQYEIAAARKAGKPIYLAVIEDCPLVAELRDVTTVIDCRSRFSASAKTLAQAIQSSKQPPQQALRRTNPLSQQIPFGRAKYRQLIWLNLCFLLGTGAILLRKQIVVHTPLNPRLDPYLVLATIPVVLWVLSFAYSLILLVAFRRQRNVTYLELEIWPVINIFAWPALFNVLFFLATNAGGSDFGPYFNAYLSITERESGDPTLPWQIILLFGAYGVYLLFVAFTMRGWLVASSLLLLIIIFNVTIVPSPVRLLVLLVVGGGIAFLSMRGFLSGRDVPVAFGERKAKYDVVHPGLADLIPWENLAWGFWLSPGAFPNEAFVGERLRLRGQSASATKGQTWRLHYVPADTGGARSFRRAFALYPELREVADDQADFQIALLSNKTPRRWLDEMAGRYPRLICVMLSSLDINAFDKALQRNQWIDYRQQQREQIHYLARALAGLPDNVNPTTPENFVRPLGPHPVKLIVHALRMGGVASLVLGIAAQIINAQYHVAAAPVPLIVVSITLGIWGWWEASRLLARNAFLPELLLTFGAILANLLYWVISAAFGALLPREAFVQNGSYNGALALGLGVIAAFIAVPFVIFLLVAGIELVRNIETLRRWLPRAARPDWRRTLAVAPWRQLDFTYVFYPVAALALIATLVVDSPYRYPQVREFDMPSASMSPGNLLVGPDGNIWFDSGDDSSYDIGYITPAGQLQTRQIVTTEPAGCQSVSTLDCTMDGGDLQVGPDHNLWYVTHRIFPPYHYVIWRSTLAGAKTPFALPDDSTFAAIAFDGAGNLWYARATVHSQLGRNNQYFIGRMDNTGHITEFALPSQSVLATFEAGPDGNFWFFDDANNTVGKITPEGKLAQYRLPYPSKGTGLGHKEMIVGPDRNLWFTDPQSGVMGRVTLKGAITLFTSGSDHFPQDLIAGPDGSVWFLDEGKANAIDRISPAGRLASYPLHALMSFHSSLTVGPDGNLWFTLYNQIGRITPEGVLKLYDVPTLDAGLSGIVTGPDGHIWFGEFAGLIGELTP